MQPFGGTRASRTMPKRDASSVRASFRSLIACPVSSPTTGSTPAGAPWHPRACSTAKPGPTRPSDWGINGCLERRPRNRALAPASKRARARLPRQRAGLPLVGRKVEISVLTSHRAVTDADHIDTVTDKRLAVSGPRHLVLKDHVVIAEVHPS